MRCPVAARRIPDGKDCHSLSHSQGPLLYCHALLVPGLRAILGMGPLFEGQAGVLLSWSSWRSPLVVVLQGTAVDGRYDPPCVIYVRLESHKSGALLLRLAVCYHQKGPPGAEGPEPNGNWPAHVLCCWLSGIWSAPAGQVPGPNTPDARRAPPGRSPPGQARPAFVGNWTGAPGKQARISREQLAFKPEVC